MKEALRILMVEDAESDAELELHELRQAGLALDFRRVETEEDFRRALVEFHPHLILSDFSMPAGFDGLTALDLAREQAPDVPFVFVSGTIGEDRVVEAMRRGATDYVLKDRLNRLVPVVQRALQEADERAARRRAELWRDGQNRISSWLRPALRSPNRSPAHVDGRVPGCGHAVLDLAAGCGAARACGPAPRRACRTRTTGRLTGSPSAPRLGPAARRPTGKSR